MKIREIKTYVLASDRRDYVFVKVETDQGLHGWGEGTLERLQQTVVQAVRDLESMLIGEDPTRIDFLWQRMYRHRFWRGGEVALSAISAIEQALWDITGKAYGQPVYKLLGGAVRDFIPCYTHTGDPEVAQRLMAEDGWNAFKSGPFYNAERLSEKDTVKRAALQFERMRKAVGSDGLLMCDCHGRYRPSMAIRIGKALEPYDLEFFEEATPPDNVLSLGPLRAAGLSMDLATGERCFTKWGYRELLQHQLVDVIQPDLVHCGGIKETIKIAAMAEVWDVRVAPHNPNGPVGTAASVHAALVMPNFSIMEYALSPTRDACQIGGESDIFKARNGRIELPTKPGLGIDLNEDYLRAHPAPTKTASGGHGAFEVDGGVANV